jgi:hypothetical protein
MDHDRFRRPAGSPAGSRPFQTRFAQGMIAAGALLLLAAAWAVAARPGWTSSLAVAGVVVLGAGLGVWWVSRQPDDLGRPAEGAEAAARRRVWPRSVRRRLLGLAVLFLALEVALFSWRDGQIERSLPFGLPSTVLSAHGIAAAMAWIWLVGVTFFLSLSPYRLDRARWKYDERQRALWDSAFRIAYQVLASVGGLYVFVRYCVLYPLAADLGVPALPPISAGILGLQFLFTVFVLPSAVMAWLEPDPPKDHAAERRASFSVIPGGRAGSGGRR